MQINIKKTLVLCFIALVCVSCSKTDATIDDSTKQAKHHVSLERALQELDFFLDNYNVATKGAQEYASRKTYNKIETLSEKDIRLNTKAICDEDTNEDLLYIVNLDDEGTAILSADDRTSDIVLAIMEKGSLTIGDFQDANNLMTNSTNTESTDDDLMHEMGNLSIPSIILSKVMMSKLTDQDDSPYPDTKAISSATKYGPYVNTKWGQSDINGTLLFNRYTPHNDPAGCVVIAVAQILMNTSNFTYTSNDGTVCKRDTMMTVANYLNPTYIGTTNAQEQTAKFVHELGSNSLLCNVTYHSGGTSGTADGAKRALEAFLYSNVEKRTGFGSDNQTRATNQIRLGRPVYLGGCHKASLSGHAWLLDGEWGNYYHINWGWNGMYDGYFSKGVFDPQNERVSTDATIDANTSYYSTNDKIKPYTWTYRMVTYSL